MDYTAHALHAISERSINLEWVLRAISEPDLRTDDPEDVEEKALNLHVDKEADALYLRLDDSAIVESEEVSPGVVLDYNESNEVVGVELLQLSKRSTNLNLSALVFETV